MGSGRVGVSSCVGEGKRGGERRKGGSEGKRRGGDYLVPGKNPCGEKGDPFRQRCGEWKERRSERTRTKARTKGAAVVVVVVVVAVGA